MKAVFLAPASVTTEAGAFGWIFEKLGKAWETGKKPDSANAGATPKIPNLKSKLLQSNNAGVTSTIPNLKSNHPGVTPTIPNLKFKILQSKILMKRRQP